MIQSFRGKRLDSRRLDLFGEGDTEKDCLSPKENLSEQLDSFIKSLRWAKTGVHDQDTTHTSRYSLEQN